MRQPMEERKVTISRAKVALDFPASFMLIASIEPMPMWIFQPPGKKLHLSARRGAEIPE